jgi:azurin
MIFIQYQDQIHIVARTAQISKEKRQSIITLRHEGQSMRENLFEVSSSAIAKTIKRYDET